MSDCCEGGSCEHAADAGAETACPRCGAVGRRVPEETIRALVRPELAGGLLGAERRVCRTPGCAVLYYGADGGVVEKGAALVRVGFKETEDPIPLCYCFGYTRAQVRREVAESGDSAIPGRIEAEIRAGRCACERKNPSGACCLGEVRKAVAEARAALVAATEP